MAVDRVSFLEILEKYRSLERIYKQFSDSFYETWQVCIQPEADWRDVADALERLGDLKVELTKAMCMFQAEALEGLYKVQTDIADIPVASSLPM